MKLGSSQAPVVFSETARIHSLWNHEFLRRCREGQLTVPEVRVLAVQMYKFCKEFVRILASILSCCPDEAAQAIILDNLWDEMGEGDSNRAHPALFRKFTRELGIDDETLESLVTEPETRAMIDTYLALPHRYGYLAALGAVCFASEGIVSTLYSQLQQGILGAAPFSQEALTFFNVHIVVDDGHAAKLASLVEPRVKTLEQQKIVNKAISEALDARVQFFNGVLRVVKS